MQCLTTIDKILREKNVERIRVFKEDFLKHLVSTTLTPQSINIRTKNWSDGIGDAKPQYDNLVN